MEIIDAFFVTLGLDPAAFKKGTKEVDESLDKTKNKAEKTQKDIDAANKKVEDSYRRIRDSILEITAAVVAAVAGKQFVNYLTESDTAASKLATNVGSTAQEVLTLQTAFKRIGASGEEVGGALRGITKILEDLKNTGGSDALYPLQRAGLDIAKFRSANSQLERMAMLATALKKLSPQDAQYFGQKGNFSEEAITLMIRYGDQLGKMFEESSKYNKITEADIEASKARTDAYAKLEGTFETMGRKITTFLTPAIDGLMNAFSSFFGMLAQSAPAAIATISTLGGVVMLLKGYSISAFAAQFTGNIASMGVAVGGLLGKLGLLGLALGGGVLAGMGLNWLAAKGLTAATGKETDLGGWIYDLFDKKDYTSANPHVYGGAGSPSRNGVSGLTRGLRNNNPGNLEYRGQAGSAPEAGSGRFAAFGSMAEGLAALDDQLRRYMSRGTDTVRAIIGKYAPAGENNTSAYIDAVARAMGVSPDMHLNPSQAGVIPGLMRGIVDQENGAGRVSMDQIAAGMQLWDSRHGGGGGGATVNIPEVHIHTTASTMTGTGADFSKSVLHHYALASASNGGVN